MGSELGASVTERILSLLAWEVGLAVGLGALGAWLTERLLRRRWSEARSRLMRAELRAMRSAALGGAALGGLTTLARGLGGPAALVPALGLVALVAWLVATLRVGRVLVFTWLFANSAREGVPALLVDLFTLGASLLAAGALVHAVFLVEVASLLATSAVVSVVLGLALQDTLGHLFAGISLQLDRPFRIGDWVEVRAGSERVSGQVLEVSWRATLLLALGEELVTIPNKTVAQGLVLNFSGRERPFIRSHTLRLPLDAPLPRAKALILQAARETPGVLAEPAPLALIIETTESWVTVKVLMFIEDFGRQFTIGDAYHARALALLGAQGIALASARLRLEAAPVDVPVDASVAVPPRRVVR
jgi:small-conductance mechanosensitive channel